MSFFILAKNNKHTKPKVLIKIIAVTSRCQPLPLLVCAPLC